MLKNNLILMLTFLSLLICSGLIIAGALIKIPNYIKVGGIKNGNLVSMANDNYHLKVNDVVFINDNKNNKFKATVTNIENNKIYLVVTNIDENIHFVTIQFKQGSLTLFEFLIKEAKNL